MDDEAAILNYIATNLRRQGYEVYAASDGIAALRKAEELSCALNLLITDVVMPGMNGNELVRAVREICPYMDVLAISGALPEANSGLVNCRFLKKPFLPRDLLQAVRNILENQIF